MIRMAADVGRAPAADPVRESLSVRAGIVSPMLPGLADIDWSSMQHAYGTAKEVPELLEQLASPDADVRDKALSHFYSAVHH